MVTETYLLGTKVVTEIDRLGTEVVIEMDQVGGGSRLDGESECEARNRLASYPGPEKGPGIYCSRMRRHPTFLWGIRNYSNLVRVS